MHTLFTPEELITKFKNLGVPRLIEDFIIGNDNIMLGDHYFAANVKMSEPFFTLYITVYDEVLTSEWTTAELNSFKFKKAIADAIGNEIAKEYERRASQ